MVVASLAAGHRLWVTHRFRVAAGRLQSPGSVAGGAWALVAPRCVESSWTRD